MLIAEFMFEEWMDQLRARGAATQRLAVNLVVQDSSNGARKRKRRSVSLSLFQNILLETKKGARTRFAGAAPAQLLFPHRACNGIR